MTRKEYLEKGSIAHREYYSQYINEDIKQRVLRTFGKECIINNNDPHFNNIMLSASTYFPVYPNWDSVFNHVCPAWINKLMREVNDDYPTQAGLVCIAKEAAEQIREKT